jgi:dolichol-phosphate mannosyltransferase
VRKISFCIPVFNEEENLHTLFGTLERFANEYKAKYEFEFFFTDNHSTDNTWLIIQKKAQTDDRYKGIRFTRNIGFENSVLANYLEVDGKAAIQFDADMQDPISVVHSFIKEWELGFKVVVGVRASREENIFLNIFRKVGYRIINKLSELPIEKDVGDFRLIDREVIELLRLYRNPKPYLRGIISEFALSTSKVSYSRVERVAGSSKIGFFALIKFGLNGLFNYSNLPIKLANFVALFTMLISISLGAYYLVARFIQTDWPEGLASTYLLILFGIAANSLFMSVILNFVKNSHTVLINSPRYIEEVRTN